MEDRALGVISMEPFGSSASNGEMNSGEVAVKQEIVESPSHDGSHDASNDGLKMEDSDNWGNSFENFGNSLLANALPMIPFPTSAFLTQGKSICHTFIF